MYRAIILSRITRLDDETITAINACGTLDKAEEEFGDVADFSLVEYASEEHYRKYDRIVNLRQVRCDGERIKRDYSIAAELAIHPSASEEDDETACFVSVNHDGDVVDTIRIPIQKYHEVYEINPLEEYYAHGNSGGICLYYDPSYEGNADSKPEYGKLYDTINNIFKARGNTLDVGGSFRNMPLDAEILTEIRKVIPDACGDFEQQTPDGDFVWDVELIHIGDADSNE